MLRELHIKNIAVIDQAHIEFSRGFNVLTGETGAGKSILIDSINMALGKRVSHDLIRTGCDKAMVNACFEVSDKAALEELSMMGIDAEDGIVTVNRQLTDDGKSTCRINGVTVPLNMARQFTSMLIDIHGQNDNRMLLDSHSHLELLDGFGENFDALEEYRAEYRNFQKIKKEIENLTQSLEERERRLDLLNFQVNEIESAKLKLGEDEELEERRNYLSNAEAIHQGAGRAYEALYGGEEASAFDLLKKAERSLSDIAEFVPKLAESLERLSGVIAETEDIASEVGSCLGNAEFSPAELDRIEERIDTINTLRRKYGGTIEEIIEYGKKASLEAETIENSDRALEELQARLREIKGRIAALAEGLTEKRSSAARILEERIAMELADLDMPKVRFFIDICDTISGGETEYNQSGKDKVEFLLSTNPGEDPKPMSKIASGGELSRIMLAVKSVLSDSGTVDTMIFDEIDTGVSGRAAQRIAEKLARLAKDRQVFSITHLAQIASMADSHYLIKKTSTDTSTSTAVTLLDKAGRVEELSRIIGGVSVTDTTRRSALEMLELAESKKEN